MATGNTHAADLINTVHHEMDSSRAASGAVRSHCFYKCIVASINKKTTHPREGASRTIHMHDEFTVGSSDKRFSDSCTPYSVKILFTQRRSRGVILHEGALSSAVRHLSYYWEKEERKTRSRPSSRPI